MNSTVCILQPYLVPTVPIPANVYYGSAQYSVLNRSLPNIYGDFKTSVRSGTASERTTGSRQGKREIRGVERQRMTATAGADAGAVETFAASLDRLDVELTRTAPADLGATLETVASDPAVGARLPFDGVALPEWVRLDPTPAEVQAARTGISPAVLAVADYGSVVLPSTDDAAEPVSLFPERHVPVVRASDVVAGMPEAFATLGPRLREDRGSFVLATGPSATADMGALVRGAHGPREVHVVLLEDGPSTAVDPGLDGTVVDGTETAGADGTDADDAADADDRGGDGA
jgi:L-lactate dehydrogenase complex protein LldG